mgnify:CR=1 FL=1
MRKRIGTKGGTSATAGKKSTTYNVTFPDGTTITKRSFKASNTNATACIYEHKGVWHCAGIYDDVPANMSKYEITSATKKGIKTTRPMDEPDYMIDPDLRDRVEHRRTAEVFLDDAIKLETNGHYADEALSQAIMHERIANGA